MSKKIDLWEKFNRYKLEYYSSEIIYSQYSSIINKIFKKIKKQIKKNPLQNYYEININNYSPKEMRIIRVFFEQVGYRINFTKPVNDMNISCISRDSTITGNLTSDVMPRSKFYIIW